MKCFRSLFEDSEKSYNVGVALEYGNNADLSFSKWGFDSPLQLIDIEKARASVSLSKMIRFFLLCPSHIASFTDSKKC